MMANVMGTQPGLAPGEEIAPRRARLPTTRSDLWPDEPTGEAFPDGEAGPTMDTGAPTGNRSELAAVVTFEVLVATYQAEIYRFALYLTGNQADADDLFQETMLKAFRAFGRLPAEANHRAWLYRIATNAFLDDRRKAARVRPFAGDGEIAVADTTVEITERLDARDLLDAVWAMITTLPPKQRIAFVLRKYHGQEYDEIATVLRTTPAAARANVHEALRKLRVAFGDRL
jgi:RNA polymerase sigma factor (sigma-70 family)